jgi:poly(A) RNA polymerase
MFSLVGFRFARRNTRDILYGLKPGLRTLKTDTLTNSGEYKPLLEIIERRRAESGRSVMVQVKGVESAPDLYSYCSSDIGNVKGMHFFKNLSTKAFTNFYIVEFEDESSVTKILNTGSHSGAESGTQPVPVTSPFLWFSGAGAVHTYRRSSPSTTSLPIFNDDNQPPGEIDEDGTISDQIFNLWKSHQITESNTRARFMVCRQVELTMKGMFSRAEVIPFGSSVNGFGKMLGDQDMYLSLDPLQDKDKGRESRLVFHSKSCVSGDRAQTRRYCDQISGILKIFLPGCQDVEKILFARVPIIKYRHELTGFDCDLSMTSSSGLYMSCLLHVWGGSDWRVRPLVTVIKHWAKSQKLVKNIRPTNYFTNFTLVMLVVCYLQQVHGMVPTVDQLTALGSEKDEFNCEDGVSVKFLQDINPHLSSINQCYNKDISLFELVQGFFEFYSQFEFNQHSLNPISGMTEVKNKMWPKTSALDIMNPIEPELNVSYNVNLAAVKMFGDRCAESRKKCGNMSDHGNKLSALFGVKDKETQLAMPRMFDVGLGKSRAKDKKRTNATHRTLHDSKSPEISLNLDSIFSEKDSDLSDQRRLEREKSLRSPKHTPGFKQQF